MANIKPTTLTGSHGAYLWLTADQRDLQSFLQRCPRVLVGKYIAVTSQDSGPLIVTDEQRLAGWQSRNDIPYSPQMQSAERIRYGACAGFDEWYVFQSPFDLGQLRHDNVLESSMTPGHVFTFVNYFGFALHEPEAQNLLDLFWKQLGWIQPESFIADGALFPTFASRNKDLFASVCQALGEPSISS
jgi:hypothetical protein